MEYNANLVQSAWTIMNSPTSSSEQKKQSNEYLTDFKITFELFLSQDTNINIFSAFIINQYIRDIISSLIESKKTYDKIKQYLFNDIMPQLEKSSSHYSELVIQRICLSSAVIVMIGSVNYWQNSIEDIIQYANGSYTKCYFALIILSNMNLDVSSLSMTQKDLTQIRDQLRTKTDRVMSFIMNIINSIPSIENNDIKQKLHKKTIELISTWVKYKLNILQMNSLCEIMLKQIKQDTIKEVSDMFYDCISNSKGAKMYTFDEVNKIDDCVSLANKEEMISITKIIEMIFNFISNYISNSENIKQNDIDDSLLIGIANIFSSISENYLYLFFTKDNQSRQLLEVLLWFISLNKRKISYKFFETISEMREFINSKYKLSNLSDNEKKEFGLYLMKISEGVMVNSKLKAIDSNYNSKLKNELIYLSNPNVTYNTHYNKQMQTNESINEIENDPNEISVIDYRKSAEDVFYNIFIILVQNYSNDGVMLFLSQVQKIIEYADINNEAIINDNNKLRAIEIVFFIMMAITESFESLEIAYEPIVNFTQCVLQSKLILNETMIMVFMLFIDKAAPYIQSNKQVYHLTIRFLFEVISHDKFYEDISSHLIFNINIFIRDVDIDIFNIVYKYYNDNYSRASKNVCINLTLALCYCISANSKNNDDVSSCKNKTILSLNDLKHYYSLIMIPSSERIKQLYNYFSNADINSNISIIDKDINNQMLIINEISKTYYSDHNILFHLSTINKQLYFELFSLHFNSTIQITKTIFELYSNKSEIIKELSGIYLKQIEKLGDEESLKYFTELNHLMVLALNSNCDNYQCINVLKLLYIAYLTNRNDKNEEIANLFFSICREQSKSVIANSNNRLDRLKLYAQFFYFVFRHLKFNINNSNIILMHKDNLMDTIRIFTEGITSYNDDSLIKVLINALSCIISHETLPQEIIKEQYANIVIKVFNAIDLFNTTNIRQFELFISSAIAFKKDLFLSTLQLLFNSNDNLKFVFNSQYAQLIITYLNLYGDDDNKVHSLISYIANIKQGNMKLDRLNYIGIEVNRKQNITHH